MLFTYKTCCKREMTDIKVLLNNVFPAGICAEICNYNLHCFKCKNLYPKENEFRKGKHLTTSERQILFSKTEMPTHFFYPTPTEQIRQMKREIDVMMDTSKLWQKFKHDKLFLMAVKSFVKMEWKTTHHFLETNHAITYMKCCKEMRERWLPQNDWTYTFRHQEFKIKQHFGHLLA